VAIACATRRQLGEVVEGDLSDPHLPRVLDDAVCDVLAQIAEDLAHGLVVNRPCRQGLGRDGGPGLRVARCAAREHVVEGARRGIALGEQRAQAGGLPCSSGDERGDDAGPVARLPSLAKMAERV
jgi:hypothetical protein